MKHVFFIISLALSLPSLSQNIETEIINQNIVLNDSIVGVTDSLVFQSKNEATLFIILFEKVPTEKLVKLKSHFETEYSCSIKGKISYKLKGTESFDITESNSDHFKKSGFYLQKAAAISNSSIVILVTGLGIGVVVSAIDPVAGGVIIIGTGVISLIQNIRTNKFLRKAGEEIAKAT